MVAVVPDVVQPVLRPTTAESRLRTSRGAVSAVAAPKLPRVGPTARIRTGLDSIPVRVNPTIATSSPARPWCAWKD